MKKKELLRRIETLEFKLDEFMYLQMMNVKHIEKLNDEVFDLQSNNK